MKFFIVALVILSSTLSMAKEGTVGNGGSSTELLQKKEFLDIATSVAKDFELWATEMRYTYISSQELTKTVYSATYKTTSNTLYLDGKKVTAINDPKTQTITVNTHEWTKLKSSGLNATKAFLLHELLGLMGIDDKNYQISGDYLLCLEHIAKSKFQKKYVLHIGQSDENDINGFPNINENEAKDVAVTNILNKIFNQLEGFSLKLFSGIIGSALITHEEPFYAETTSLIPIEKSVSVVINSCGANYKIQNIYEMLTTLTDQLTSKKLITSANVHRVSDRECSSGVAYRIDITYSIW